MRKPYYSMPTEGFTHYTGKLICRTTYFSCSFSSLVLFPQSHFSPFLYKIPSPHSQKWDYSGGVTQLRHHIFHFWVFPCQTWSERYEFLCLLIHRKQLVFLLEYALLCFYINFFSHTSVSLPIPYPAKIIKKRLRLHSIFNCS